MKVKEKMLSLYEKVSATLSNQYNIDYISISEAIETIAEAWKKEAAITNIGDVGPRTKNIHLTNLYMLKLNELADLITEAKCAMLDINQYCTKYETEKVFDINVNTSAKDIMDIVHSLLDDVVENREEITEIPVDDIIGALYAPIEYYEKDFNIDWEMLVMEKYGDYFVEKQDSLMNYEYDPETDELYEIQYDEIDL